MPTTRLEVWSRLNSLCADDPFRFTRAVSPFNFDHQPSGQIDQVFRVTAEADAVIGGFNFSEERTDTVEVWVARRHMGDQSAAYESLLTDVTSLTAAITRDGSTGGGDYCVVDGGTAQIEHPDGADYSVARLALLVNYESVL